MSYKNLAVRKKIAVVFSAISLVMIAFGFFLLQELNKVEAEVINFTESTIPSVLSVEGIYFDMNTYRRNQYAALNYKEKDLPGLLSKILEQELSIKKQLAAYDATVASEGERQVFDRVANSWAEYLRVLNGFTHKINNGEKDLATVELVNALSQFEETGAAMDALVEANIVFVTNNRTAIMGSVSNVTMDKFFHIESSEHL